MSDRFDLEQDLIQAWGIIDDINRCESLEDVRTVTAYYQLKFDRLWATFEQVVAEYKFVKRSDE